MNYKVGDKVEFVLNGVLQKGEVIQIKKWPFKKYRIAYKILNIAFYKSMVVWIKAKDLIGIDKGVDRSGVMNTKPPSLAGVKK